MEGIQTAKPPLHVFHYLFLSKIRPHRTPTPTILMGAKKKRWDNGNNGCKARKSCREGGVLPRSLHCLLSDGLIPHREPLGAASLEELALKKGPR
jgi:hypothetical protein